MDGICARPGCGKTLNARQRYNRNRYCSLLCSRRRRDYLFPVPPAPVAPAPVFAEGWIGGPSPDRAAADVLGREGRTVYTKGTLNGHAFVMDGPGSVYCAFGAWEASPAARRIREGPRGADSGQLARISTAAPLRGWSL